MKNLLAFVTFYMFTLMHGYTQMVAFSPTTTEEYNYVTKGYPTQMTEGLDMKKGYHFKDMFNIKQGNYTFASKMLIRESTNEVAAILVVAKSLIWNKIYYFCIPRGNQELTNRYWEDLSTLDRAMSIAYGQIMSLGFGGAVATAYDMEKKMNNHSGSK